MPESRAPRPTRVAAATAPWARRAPARSRAGLAARALDGSDEDVGSSADVQHEALVALLTEALEAGVFGAPSYVLNGEVFWGQDRLEFLEHRLAAA